MDRDTQLLKDTGADVTTVLHSAITQDTLSCMIRPTKARRGPERSKMHKVGQLELDVSWNGKMTRQETCVVDGLRHALLGRPALQALSVLPQLLAVEESPGHDQVPAKFPELFASLGRWRATYSIRLIPGTRPHAVTYPRRIPVSLLPDVQAEIRRMQDLGVIQKVDHATDWCGAMVLAKNKDDKLRIFLAPRS